VRSRKQTYGAEGLAGAGTVAALSLAALVACSSVADTVTDATVTQLPPHEATAVAAREKGYERVWITTETQSGEYRFIPNEFTFTEGDTVRFILRGEVSPYGYWYHTFTIPKVGMSVLVPNRSKTIWVTFEEPGVYEFLCLPHPWMTGTITVLQKETAS
jgi:plastocyanin